MDTPTLVGTGFLILGGVVWVVSAIYAWRMAPTFGRNRIGWTIAAIIFGPLALMVLYILPAPRAPARPRQVAQGPAGRAVREAPQALGRTPRATARRPPSRAQADRPTRVEAGSSPRVRSTYQPGRVDSLGEGTVRTEAGRSAPWTPFRARRFPPGGNHSTGPAVGAGRARDRRAMSG